MGLTLMVRGHIAFFLSAKFASLGVFDCEFRGMEQQEKPRVREFRELWIASLRGLSVFHYLKRTLNIDYIIDL